MLTTQRLEVRAAGRTARLSLVLGYVVAAAAVTLRVLGSETPLSLLSLRLPGDIAFFVLLSIPPTLALFAMRGRPNLFAAAGIFSITLGSGMWFFSPVIVPLGVVWLWMYVRSKPERILRALGAAVAVWVLGAAAFMVLFVHLDPRCIDTYADGTVQILPLGATGTESGWIWDASGTSTGGSVSKPGVVMSGCVSDIVTWAEAGVSVVFASAALGSGRVIAGASKFARDIVESGNAD